MSEASEVWLSSNDPQPRRGTIVETEDSYRWIREDFYGYWYREDLEDGESESWIKVAGNYGPVKVIEWGDGDA